MLRSAPRILSSVSRPSPLLNFSSQYRRFYNIYAGIGSGEHKSVPAIIDGHENVLTEFNLDQEGQDCFERSEAGAWVYKGHFDAEDLGSENSKRVLALIKRKTRSEMNVFNRAFIRGVKGADGEHNEANDEVAKYKQATEYVQAPEADIAKLKMMTLRDHISSPLKTKAIEDLGRKVKQKVRGLKYVSTDRPESVEPLATERNMMVYNAEGASRPISRKGIDVVVHEKAKPAIPKKKTKRSTPSKVLRSKNVHPDG